MGSLRAWPAPTRFLPGSGRCGPKACFATSSSWPAASASGRTRWCSPRPANPYVSSFWPAQRAPRPRLQQCPACTSCGYPAWSSPKFYGRRSAGSTRRTPAAKAPPLPPRSSSRSRAPSACRTPRPPSAAGNPRASRRACAGSAPRASSATWCSWPAASAWRRTRRCWRPSASPSAATSSTACRSSWQPRAARTALAKPRHLGAKPRARPLTRGQRRRWSLWS
mmetsp:Transcript_10728/g.33418  ORF Transcript_10728/g.33418 Transcript_10728/m.33418 type:complete len:223 (+) Transcript_10728:86-754(+)